MSVALVTGAAGAIGRAISLRLARDGAQVLCVDLSERVEETSALIAERGGSAVAHVADLADGEALPGILRVAARLDGVSVLVNNAGIARDGRATKLSEADFRAVIRVDAVAPLRLAEALAPAIVDHGSIVNIASRAGLGNFGQANYVAAKAALIGATRALAIDLSPRLRANAVAPGLVETPMTAAMPPEVLEKLTARVPLGRMADPSEIADAVAFLASPAARYVTGQTLLACGGRSLV